MGNHDHDSGGDCTHHVDESAAPEHDHSHEAGDCQSVFTEFTVGTDVEYDNLDPGPIIHDWIGSVASDEIIDLPKSEGSFGDCIKARMSKFCLGSLLKRVPLEAKWAAALPDKRLAKKMHADLVRYGTESLSESTFLNFLKPK